MMRVKTGLAILYVVLSLVCQDSARVWLSCQAIIGISVLVGLFRVLQIQSQIYLIFTFALVLIQYT